MGTPQYGYGGSGYQQPGSYPGGSPSPYVGQAGYGQAASGYGQPTMGYAPSAYSAPSRPPRGIKTLLPMILAIVCVVLLILAFVLPWISINESESEDGESISCTGGLYLSGSATVTCSYNGVSETASSNTLNGTAASLWDSGEALIGLALALGLVTFLLILIGDFLGRRMFSAQPKVTMILALLGIVLPVAGWALVYVAPSQVPNYNSSYGWFNLPSGESLGGGFFLPIVATVLGVIVFIMVWKGRSSQATVDTGAQAWNPAASGSGANPYQQAGGAYGQPGSAGYGQAGGYGAQGYGAQPAYPQQQAYAQQPAYPEQQAYQPQATYQQPSSAYPQSGYGQAAYQQPAQSSYGQPQAAAGGAGSAPLCRNCGRPTSYVPQYSRYYCMACALYV